MTRPPRVAPWLLLLFRLPARSASQRVDVWRKLRRYGALLLKQSGYLLPNSPVNRERLEWLAAVIRKSRGEASVLQVQSVDNLSFEQLAQRFTEARSRDYQRLVRDLTVVAARPPQQRSAATLRRLRQRYQALLEIDFFQSALRSRVEHLLERAESPDAHAAPEPKRFSPRHYRKRKWATRPRPGIDRAASAWLIRHYIDPQAKFVFAANGRTAPGAVGYDLFQCEFGHRGEDCTFETLRKSFRIRDRKVALVAQMVHDADLGDDKFGRKEALGIDQVLKGWARQDMPDRELLERGMSLIDGLYHSLG